MFWTGIVQSTSLTRTARSAEGNCPVILAKPISECQGVISECWSPGQFDVDCDEGATVCCFNGCVNVCGEPKVCKTVYQMKFENTTKEMCLPVEQPPNCSTVTVQDCYDDCKNVDSVIPTQVEENVCNTVFEPVCEAFETETCVPPGLNNFFLKVLTFFWPATLINISTFHIIKDLKIPLINCNFSPFSF